MKKSVRLAWLWGILVFGGVVSSASATEVSASGKCGDFNNNNSLTVSDLTALNRYLFYGDVPPLFPTQADCDDYMLITVRDIQLYSRFLFNAGDMVTCPPSHSEPLSLDSSDVLTVAGFAPANSSSTELVLSLTFAGDSMSAFVLPLQILLDGNPVSMDSVTLSDLTEPWLHMGDRSYRIDTANSVLLTAAFTLWDAHAIYKAPGTYEVARVQVSYASADTARDFSYAWKPLRPVQTMTGYPDTSLVPMVVGRYSNGAKAAASVELPASAPILSSTRIKHGDVNGSGTITMMDITALVRFLFVNGPTPSLEGADANCNGIITITDLTTLVGYLFAAGPAPCAN